MFRLVAIIIIYLTFCLQLNAVEKQVFIKKKINELFITNLDVEIEIKYLKTLNPSLANKTKNNILINYAENSLINEKIKYIELSKFFDVDDLSKLPEVVIDNFYKKLGFTNQKQFEEYINNNNLDYNIVLQKLNLEHLWNSLIYSKYIKKINIDEEKIKNELEKQIKSEKKIIQFDLNEIIFTIKNKSELESRFEQILQNIQKIGFEDTARLYSLSESAKFGGKLGWVNENQISSSIRKEIKKLKVGNFTKPIKITDGYMILFLKDKKISEKQIDIDKALSKALAYERDKQLGEFSRLYFKKIAVNTKIE